MMKRSTPVANPIQYRKPASGGGRSSGFACFLRIAGIARFMTMTECQAVPPGFVELEHDLRVAVDEIQRVIRSDAQAVSVLENAFAPRIQQLARLVEHDVRM